MTITVSKLAKAKAALIIDQPFFASILCQMPITEDPNLPYPTAATNGKWIKFHPEFVEKCSHDELVFVLCHEVGHIVFRHMFRRAERNPLKWNIAGDYIINDMLVEDKIGKMPEHTPGYHNSSLVQAGGGTTEGVFNILPDDDDHGGGGGDQPGGGYWDFCEDTPGTAAEQSAAEAQARVMIAQAAQAAKMQGKLSAGLQRLVDASLKPKVDWKDVTRRFVSTKAKIERSYARPKRRFLADDLYLPALGGEKLGRLLIAVDCSGSCWDVIPEFAAEIKAIKEDCRPYEVHVVYFDTVVSHHDVFEDDDTLHIEAHGGGGTAFSPIFAFADKHDIDPVACVVLTDLYCSDFGPAPSYPVLWVTNGATEAPWGEVVKMDQGL